MKKIKVTKRTRTKVPWYERPPLLFGVIAIALAGAGLLMAHLNRGTGAPDVLGSGSVSDTTEAQAAQPVAGQSDSLQGQHVLRLGDPLVAPEPGGLLPPIEVETLGEAADVRIALREAHGARLGGQSPGAAGFLEAGDLLAAASAGRLTPESWGELGLSTEHRPWSDYELHWSADDAIYLVAFVSLEVAEALGTRAPDLTLPPPEPQPEIPWWQFWKSAPEPEELVLTQGSQILLYPDLNPVATCAVALPREHLQPEGIQRVQTGLEQPMQALEVTLR